MSHSQISPAILYFGTPVAIISSSNEDGTSNLAAISSVWWLGHRCMLGFGAGKTPQNIFRTKQCVINLPDDTMTPHVNRLAVTTGDDPVSEAKKSRNYQFVKDKWTWAKLTPEASELVAPTRVKECPVQMECELAMVHPMMQDLYGGQAGLLYALEMRVCRIYVRDDLRMSGFANRIDPDKWRPLIMSFQEFYGLRDKKVDGSELGKVNEEKYRAFADIDDEKTAAKFRE
ncbi:hypothetical protein N0V90_001236 [Kalmusia sp. IMI 367209]|nr:hypothetical protein N0V90_001236 [Kalmusia sp. IMI 367209]